ncbi:MAG: hypothetical protein ACM3L8_04805 [Verrucomicrobiota bacterium]
MKPYPVYRIDKESTARTRIGAVVERRRRDRGNNFAGLLRLAAARFKSSPHQVIQIDFQGMLVEL